MVIVLPNEIDGLKALEGTLGASNINDILRDLHSAKVRVSLPKFKLEKFIDLSAVLQTVSF